MKLSKGAQPILTEKLAKQLAINLIKTNGVCYKATALSPKLTAMANIVEHRVLCLQCHEIGFTSNDCDYSLAYNNAIKYLVKHGEKGTIMELLI